MCTKLRGHNSDYSRYLIFLVITIIVIAFVYKPVSTFFSKCISEFYWIKSSGTVESLEKYCIPVFVTNGVKSRNRQLEPMDCNVAQSIAKPSSEGKWLIIPTMKARVSVAYDDAKTDHYFFPSAIGRPFVIGEKLKILVNPKDENTAELPIIDRDIERIIESLTAALFMILVSAVVVFARYRK